MLTLLPKIGDWIEQRKDDGKMDTTKEFVAYAKQLLRHLVRLKKLLDNNQIDEAKELLNGIIEDTKGDTQA